MQPKVLVIDEVGYLQLDRVQASLLFQVICNRYERRQPIVLTSNKAFSEWGQVQGNRTLDAGKMFDKSLDHRVIPGTSFTFAPNVIFDGSVPLQNAQCKTSKNG